MGYISKKHLQRGLKVQTFFFFFFGGNNILNPFEVIKLETDPAFGFFFFLFLLFGYNTSYSLQLIGR